MSTTTASNAAPPAPAPRRKRPGLPLAYRLHVLSRTVAALAGGYALAASAAACLSLWLPSTGMSRPDAVLAATMLAFLVHATAALWAFGCASTRRAWLGIGVPTLLLGAYWLSHGAGGLA